MTAAFRPKMTGGPTVDSKGEKCFNETHQLTTDPDVRPYKKGEGDECRWSYLGDALIENRDGLVVDVEMTHATSMVEPNAVLAMVRRRIVKPGATLGVDNSYDAARFVKELRGWALCLM